MNTIQCVNHRSCTGCGACTNVCPVDAIRMSADKEGFLFPQVDEAYCVMCGKCTEVCPVCVIPKSNTEETLPICYAAWSRDEDLRFSSTSGGVFSHLAQEVIKRRGVVVGAKYLQNNLVGHALATTMEGIEAFRQSKYIQSDMGMVYREVQKALESGRLVMFSGTPCQCAAMKSYLGCEYENLLLCDFICLGVNSPMVYLRYLNELEERYGAKAKQVWFKNKSFGWNRFSTKILFENGREYVADRESDLYMQGYIKANRSLYMRQSCYHCDFRGLSRPVDFTLGDFWGIERYLENIDSKNGISAILVQSTKGEAFFESCKEQLYCHQMKASEVLPCNPRVLENVKCSEKREVFFDMLEKEGFKQAMLEIMEKEGGE